ncbi:hypothetical protein D9Q98_002508 [Chlorella vulgaris]|uniref:Uncharacterized protein n=1 Tax=Chlorella vulgaris TaxID=3077 RepID=A0A9D4TTN1_CHLVU|nr:hypothetical protein D9Q98_002508 [Chlorella vulgaris]
MHHKGRVKMTALPSGGGNSALLPISASLSRQYSSDQLYRTASSGTPSKWRRGGPGPARRAVQLAGCVLALLLCYKSLGGSHISASEHALVVQQQQQQQMEQQQVGLLEGRKLPQQLRVERQQQQRQGQQQAQPREQQQQEPQVQQQLQVVELQAGHQQRQETALAALQGGQEGQQNDLSPAQASSQQTEQQQQQQQGQEQQQQQEGQQQQQQHQEQAQASQEQAAQQQPEQQQQQQQPQQQRQQHRQLAPALSSEQQAARLSIAQHRQHQQQAAQQYAGPLPHPAPKVALMFLVRGNMPLEAVWREFFAAAAQIEPVALPPPFEAAAAVRTSQQHQQKGRVVEQQQQQQQQQQVVEQQQQQGRRRRLATEADGDERTAAAALQQGSDAVGEAGVAGAVAAQQQGQLTEEQQQQQQQEQRHALGQAAPQLEGQEEQTWPPLSEFEQKQVEANQQLAAALGAGEVLQGAVAEAREATTMEAPYSMMSSVDPAGVIAQQDLFSVYVHTLPGFTYPNTSIFSGHQINRRVYVHWGQYTVAEAERRLIWFALQEPRNARFVLVSETCTPLYPPHVFYLQLLSEIKSRVNACSGEGGAVADRWHSALYLPGVLGPQRWRKSAQWKSLIRQHAQLVVADRQLAPRFERECYSYFPPKIGQPPYVAAQQRQWVPRTCVSDEHYVPTLLAVHGQDQRTTCSDALTAADWVPGLWSPLIHTAADVNADLVFRLRKERWSDVDCQAAEAEASAATMFRRRGAAVTLAGQPVPVAAGGSSGSGNVRRLWQQEGQQQQHQQQQAGQQAGQQADQRQQQAGQQQRMQGFSPLTDHCYLLARKFTPDTAPLLVELARDCSSGTGISAQCLPGQQQQR